MTEEFEYMNDAVDEICRSLREEPHLWRFDTCHFHKKGTDIQYWTGTSNSAIMQIWDGRDTSQVFSYNQGKKIKAAYDVARRIVANTKQDSILKEFGRKEKDITPKKPVPPPKRLLREGEVPDKRIVSEDVKFGNIIASIKKLLSRIKFTK